MKKKIILLETQLAATYIRIVIIADTYLNPVPNMFRLLIFKLIIPESRNPHISQSIILIGANIKYVNLCSLTGLTEVQYRGLQGVIPL